MTKWIKISEDKPDGEVGDSRDVLVTNGKKMWVMERYHFIKGITFYEHNIVDGYDGYYSEDYQNPTHWSELPEFPVSEANV